MSNDELKLKLSFDTSDAAKAADALPDAMDRASRKKYVRGLKWESAITQDQIAAQEKERKQQDDDYKRRLKWNSQLTADEIAANEKAEKDAKKAAKEEEARKEKEQKQANKDFIQRVKWNSKLQEDQDKAAAHAGEWADKFADRMENLIVNTIGPLALIMKGINMAFDKVNAEGELNKRVLGAEEQYGMAPNQVRWVRELADLSKNLTADEHQAISERVSGRMREYALGLSSEGQRGFQAFGFDREKFMSGQQTYLDLLYNASEAYLKYGKSARFAIEAESVFGKEWTKMRGILSTGRAGLSTDFTGAQYHAEDYILPSTLANVNLQRRKAGQSPITSLMGGGEASALPQQLSNVTSLQAMGGGDILSAIARGPQERTAVATEGIFQKVTEIGAAIQIPNGGWFPAAKTTLNKH